MWRNGLRVRIERMRHRTPCTRRFALAWATAAVKSGKGKKSLPCSFRLVFSAFHDFGFVFDVLRCVPRVHYQLAVFYYELVIKA